ncbi:ferritin ribonucleotide reductase [Pyrenophora seminiperda CCB06]|uniref:Ferritin ribonucleotide reductase n=1 Tax=Pyrenophora seminiperda CCB06 TaxID=1302712 RepID=A0A3M7M6E1_9PLEO|nr:ferritin ribonucleotide reductase [Pyrenophora seminiperda CCB06]
MKSTITALASILALTSNAAPTKRATTPITDGDILNYALTLEHLEDTFYREALAKYTLADFIAANFTEETYMRIQTIASDEKTHVSFLTSALTAAGAKPVAECTYDFGYKDVAGFMATASVLEGVGVSAYLGAAADIMSKTYLTAAGSILTVEARHSSYIRNSIKESPFPSPFDNPLGLNEVYTLAAPFIKSCPESNVALPVKAFPMLAASAVNGEEIKAGGMVMVSTKDYKIEGEVYAAFITVTGPVWAEVMMKDGGYEVTIPEGIAGQSYLVFTSCKDSATDDTIVAGPALVEVSA